MKEKIVKGLIQVVMAFLTMLSGGYSLLVAGLVALVNMAGYSISNLLWTSNSPQGTLNWKDWIKGLLLAGVGGFGAFLASLLPGQTFTWQAFIMAAASAIMAYLAPTTMQGSKK